MEERELMDLMKDRHSCRAYLDKPVEEKKIEKIIEAGILSPTGMNRQNTIFLAIKDERTIRELSRINASFTGNPNGDPFYGAKEVIVVLASKQTTTRVYDGSIALGYMMLEATALGLGCCWIHRAKESFSTEEGKAILAKAGIAGDYEGIGNLIVGYEDKSQSSCHPKSSQGRIFAL